MDEYDLVKKKPLKALVDESKKRKKKKSKIPKQMVDPTAGVPSQESKVILPTVTKAEKAFKSKQEDVAESRILKKALKSHKQRVEEFNKHLDSLTEHYDIPKVSWTK